MKTSVLFIVLLISIWIFIAAASATTIYVCTDGTCGNYNCDGTDDQVQMQWAINNASGGDTVFINSSTYNITDTVWINDSANITVGGAGWSNTIINGTIAGGFDFFGVNNSDFIYFQNIDFKTDAPTKPTNDIHAFYAAYSNNITIDACRANHTTSLYEGKSGSETGGVPSNYDMTINNSESHHGKYGIRAVGDIRMNIYNLTITNTVDSCMNLQYQQYGVIDSCIIDTTGSCTMFLYGVSTYNLTVKNNTIKNSHVSGIWLWQAHDITIINNTITDNTRAGIRVYGTATHASQGALIKNNIIGRNGWSGILFDEEGTGFSSLNNSVICNTIFNNTQDGLKISFDNCNITAKNNIYYGNGGYGVNQTTANASFAINISYSDFYANINGNWNYSDATGIGNITSNPEFYNIINNDFYLNSTAGTWNGAGWEIMNANSPCIDTGNPSDDYSNEPSPNGSRINMGTYGNTLYASKSPEGTGNISGFIYSTNTNPVQDAVCYVSYTNGSYIAKINTSADGSYNFTNILAGSYYIFAKEIGASSDRSTNITVTANTTTWCNLTLYREESATVGQNIFVDLGSSFDFEGDALSYSCNRTDLFTDFDTTNGTGNWTCTYGIKTTKFGVSDGVGYSNKSIIFDVAGKNYIYTGANEWMLFNNWSSASQTFSQIATNESNDLAYSYYNSTSGLWESYWAGYSINQDNSIPKNESLLGYFDAPTTITCDVPSAESVAIPANVWFYTYLRESTTYNLTQINASIVSDGCVISAIYGFQNDTQAYNSTGSYTVSPNEGFTLYATTGCNWDGSV